MRVKPSLFAGLLLLSFDLFARPCFAQDLIAGPARAEDTPPPADDPSWTGLHLGISAGARLADAAWTTDCLAPGALPGTCPNDGFGGSTRIGNDNPASFDSLDARLGAYLGVDWQLSHVVVGVEADASWMENSEEQLGIPGAWSTDFGPGIDAARIESTWDASVRARGGFLITPTVLIYSTGGIAFLHQEVSARCDGTFPAGWCSSPNSDSDSVVLMGWTAGGGFEKMFGHAWIVRGEYRYSEFESRSLTLFDDAPLDSLGVTVDETLSTAYLGLSRKF